MAGRVAYSSDEEDTGSLASGASSDELAAAVERMAPRALDAGAPPAPPRRESASPASKGKRVWSGGKQAQEPRYSRQVRCGGKPPTTRPPNPPPPPPGTPPARPALGAPAGRNSS